MQLVDGVSLAEHLRVHGPLTVERAAVVADAVLRALDAAHDAGIVHRDVKPANIMLAGERVLLTDFGIALHQNDTVLTADGVLVGTPEYIAPERADDTADRAAGDLFSLGATLYHALEGVSPFRRDGLWETVAAVIGHEPPVPQRAGPLRPLLTALLNKDPRLRPTAAGALTLLSNSGRLDAHLPPAHPPTERAGLSQMPPPAKLQDGSLHVAPVPERQRAAAAALTTAAHIARSLAGENPADTTTRIAELLKQVDPRRVDTLVDEAIRLLPPARRRTPGSRHSRDRHQHGAAQPGNDTPQAAEHHHRRAPGARSQQPTRAGNGPRPAGTPGRRDGSPARGETP
jgi:serine/threonine protein kinase